MFDSQKNWGKMRRKDNREENRRKEKVRKIKNRLKLNKLFLYTFSNSFYLFYFII